MTDQDRCLEFLRADGWGEFPVMGTDQQRGLPRPLLEKPAPAGAPTFALPAVEDLHLGDRPLRGVIATRRSRRHFSPEALSLEELAFLLWATQGVRGVIGGNQNVLRTVPSAGARHPFETYLAVQRVEGLEPGLYRYLSLSHRLCLIKQDSDVAAKVLSACLGQGFAGQAAVTFLWTAIPYRTQWRYSRMAPKLIALDAGHVCQNLYLAAEAIGAGTCAIGAYDQDQADALVGADGVEEMVVYIAPVGRLAASSRE